MLKTLIVLALTLNLIVPQTCQNHTGSPVAWWVVIKVPPKTGHHGYGYYDSSMKTGTFIYYPDAIDIGSTPLTKTFEAVNKNSMDHLAWNDEKPTGEVSSSLAHAKGMIAYSLDGSASKGILFSHSIPKYPYFFDEKVQATISDSQNYYGQHLACFTLTLKELDEIAEYMLITMPFIYKAKVTNTTMTRNLYKLAKSQFVRNSTSFNKHQFLSPLGYNLKTIYKNNQVNGSIFEDGLAEYLVVGPIIAQTWGRPLQAAWCSGRYEVFNVNSLHLGGVTWNEQDDHSKWAIGHNYYACLGDMNRMTSQWKRGGSFFCLSEPTLVLAFKRIITVHDNC